MTTPSTLDLTSIFTVLGFAKLLSIFLALHMLHIGLWAYTSPRGLCQYSELLYSGKMFHSNIEKVDSRNTEDVRHDIYWPLLFAPREVGFALLILVFSWTGDWYAVGLVVLVVAGLLATTDGVVAALWGKGGLRSAFTSHGIPAIVLGAVAYVLLLET